MKSDALKSMISQS